MHGSLRESNVFSIIVNALFPEDAAGFRQANDGFTIHVPDAWRKTFEERQVNYVAAGRLNYVLPNDVGDG